MLPLARLRAKMHVTLRGLARTLQVTSRRDPRGALRVTLRVPREARARGVCRCMYHVFYILTI